MIRTPLGSFISPLKARLSRKIAFWAFLSLVVIEAIILVPSYQRREKELLTDIEQVGLATIKPWIGLYELGLSDQTPAAAPKTQLIFDSHLLGARVYTNGGELIASFGDLPGLTFADFQASGDSRLLNKTAQTYDVIWPVQTFETTDETNDYVVIAQLDAASVQPEVTAFFWRIVWLVLIIGIFVTAGTMLALGPLVLQPILRLRKGLQTAGKAIDSDQLKPALYPVLSPSRDELGEVIQAFQTMVDQIYHAISDRK